MIHPDIPNLVLFELGNEILAKHTGQDTERLGVDSDRDRWMRPEEAKEYGLIDDIIQRHEKAEEIHELVQFKLEGPQSWVTKLRQRRFTGLAKVPAALLIHLARDLGECIRISVHSGIWLIGNGR